MPQRPGGELAKRPLHFIWICDCSGSMDADGKIQQLNTAIKESIFPMQKSAENQPNAQILIRAIKFSDNAEWIIPSETPVEQFKWFDLAANGVTAMGKALSMVADVLTIPPMTDRAFPPVLVLLSDGQPTDDFDIGLQKLMGTPWGRKAVRIAIAIGGDADLEILQKFIGKSDIKPFRANNAEMLAKQIKFVTTQVTFQVSNPATSPIKPTPIQENVPVVTVPDEFFNADPDKDVW